jgi:hypothetical protein
LAVTRTGDLSSTVTGGKWYDLCGS